MPFREIVGHRQLVGLLTRAVVRDTLPPSLVFSGPSGVGKATTAVALAELLNCERTVEPPLDAIGEGWDACGRCAACRAIARAALAFRERRERPAIDCLQWLEPDDKASIKIDPVRQVLGRAGFRPFDGRRRVVIVNDAHALEVPAQQALLKMLEEPPSTTRFVLVTDQPDVLLPTIRSRCPQLRFGPIPASDVAGALVTRHGWTEAEARAAAALADGRLGRALDSADDDFGHARDVAADVLSQVASSQGPSARLEAAQALLARGETPRRKGGRGRGSGAVTRQEISARLDAMSALLRDIGVLSTRASERRLANVDLASSLGRLTPAFAGDRLVRAFATVDRARQALDRNASQKIVADWLVLNL